MNIYIYIYIYIYMCVCTFCCLMWWFCSTVARHILYIQGLLWFCVCFAHRNFESKDSQLHLRPLGLARRTKTSSAELKCVLVMKFLSRWHLNNNVSYMCSVAQCGGFVQQLLISFISRVYCGLVYVLPMGTLNPKIVNFTLDP